MTLVKRISGAVREKLNNKFVRNVGWLGGSELMIRVVRLVTTAIIAKYMSTNAYGQVALVMAVNEFSQVFTRVGIGAKIIQYDKEDLNDFCNAAYWLNWLVFVGLFFGQCLAAFPIARFYREDELVLPICASALIYLIVPISSIQASLITRENRLNVVAFNNSIQLSVSSILTAVFAFLQFGVWSVVIARVLVAPIWVYNFYTHHSWRPTQGFTTKYWGEIFTFGRNIFGVQLLKTLRNNLDYLIIGRYLGIASLGRYYFAFNAGLGISLSLINAISGALLPHLCAARSDWSKFQQQYFSSLKMIAITIIPLVALQSSLAPFYVPLVFGAKWVPTIPILILICLSAIPRPFAEAASQLLVAVDRPDLDLRWNVIFTALFAMAIFLGVRWGSIGVAISVLAVHTVFLPGFSLWATHFVFRRLKPAIPG